MQLPASFQQSYLNYTRYPCNLAHRSVSTYPTALKALKSRLDSAAPDLFESDGTELEVPIRDLQTASGKALDKYNIHTPSKLTDWLGIEMAIDSTDATKRVVTTKKKDPKCRLIYVYAEHSRARLKITGSMLAQILTFHQVMPTYLDFIQVFGAQSEPHDLKFSGFRQQTALTDATCGVAIPSLGRSGRHFQLCYSLKSVALKTEDKSDVLLNQWSIRPAAIYHHFDVVEGRTLWIVTKGNLDIHQRFKELTGEDTRPEDKAFGTVDECFRSSLAAHLLYCYWSAENWRWYIKWLERAVDKESKLAVLGPLGNGHAHTQYKPHHIQDLQYWEDKASEAIAVLQANAAITTSLRDFYAALKANKHFPSGESCGDDIIQFNVQLDDMIYDLHLQITRAEALVKIAGDRKELIIQHLQSQATERMERLNQNMERDASVMRIITIVTLIYLPPTVVSTFFSTDIIKFQNRNDSDPNQGTFSEAALYAWLKVALPMTFATLIFAWFAKRWEHTKRGSGQLPQKVQRERKPLELTTHRTWILPMYNKLQSKQ